MDSEQVVTLATGIAWPLTVFVLAAMFREELAAVLNRIDTFTFGKNVISWRPADDNLEPDKGSTTEDEGAAVSAGWENVADVYWLGHDIMWTRDAVLRGAPPDRIVHGLRQSLKHVKGIGLSEAAPAESLKRLHENVQDISAAEWGRAARERYASELRRISWQLGTKARAKQNQKSET